MISLLSPKSPRRSNWEQDFTPVSPRTRGRKSPRLNEVPSPSQSKQVQSPETKPYFSPSSSKSSGSTNFLTQTHNFAPYSRQSPNSSRIPLPVQSSPHNIPESPPTVVLPSQPKPQHEDLFMADHPSTNPSPLSSRTFNDDEASFSPSPISSTFSNNRPSSYSHDFLKSSSISNSQNLSQSLGNQKRLKSSPNFDRFSSSHALSTSHSPSPAKTSSFGSSLNLPKKSSSTSSPHPETELIASPSRQAEIRPHISMELPSQHSSPPRMMFVVQNKLWSDEEMKEAEEKVKQGSAYGQSETEEPEPYSSIQPSMFLIEDALNGKTIPTERNRTFGGSKTEKEELDLDDDGIDESNQIKRTNVKEEGDSLLGDDIPVFEERKMEKRTADEKQANEEELPDLGGDDADDDRILGEREELPPLDTPPLPQQAARTSVTHSADLPSSKPSSASDSFASHTAPMSLTGTSSSLSKQATPNNQSQRTYHQSQPLTPLPNSLPDPLPQKCAPLPLPCSPPIVDRLEHHITHNSIDVFEKPPSLFPLTSQVAQSFSTA